MCYVCCRSDFEQAALSYIRSVRTAITQQTHADHSQSTLTNANTFTIMMTPFNSATASADLPSQQQQQQQHITHGSSSPRSPTHSVPKGKHAHAQHNTHPTTPTTTPPNT